MRLLFASSVLVAGSGWLLLERVNKFHVSAIPRGPGKVVVVTGANAGLGLATVRAFVRADYQVVMACRSKERGEAALASLKEEGVNGSLSLEIVDLAEPQSISAFASAIRSKHGKVDILINNAATMGTPEMRNSLGWESQIANGHLGHFILTSRLLPLLQAANGRVVNVSSLKGFDPFHGFDIQDMLFERRAYDPFVAYGSTKRANMLFTYEFNRRFAQHGVSATVAHPGVALTDLLTKAKGYEESSRWWFLFALINNRAMQSIFMAPDDGALSQIRAAVDAHPDAFIGPAFVISGPPVCIGTSLRAWFNPFPFRPEDAAELWRKSEEITGERFPPL